MIALGEGRNAFANLRESHAELLSALIQILPLAEAHYKTSSEGAPSILVARAAIAKAEGRAECL